MSNFREAVGRSGKSARDRALAKLADAGPRFRELLAMEADRPLSPEKLVLLIVAAVREDEKDRNLHEVKDIAKRNERLASLAAMVPGGRAIVDLYCDADLVTELSDTFKVGLSNEEIAARLLVMWGVLPTLEMARRAIDVEDDEVSVAEHVGARIQGRAPSIDKKQALVLLKQARSRLAEGKTARKVLGSAAIINWKAGLGVLTPGAALRARLQEAAAVLGLAPDAVRKTADYQAIRERNEYDVGATIALVAETPSVAGIEPPVATVRDAGWHPDPDARFELRYHDGLEWTEHVSHQGSRLTDWRAGPATSPLNSENGDPSS